MARARAGGGSRARLNVVAGLTRALHMHPTDWQRTWDIFFEAIELPADARVAYLRQACGDDVAFLRKVEELIVAHERPGRVLDRPPPLLAELATETELPGSVIGQHIGRYRVVREIGSGGMGTVYEAEQEAPVRRRVALKLIKLGMDTREVVRRFEAERQALALMNHSNIARVYDAGATDDGRPYFVMELVEGVPVTAYCDEHSLPIRDRLLLLMAVCDGVQHAHHKGVIHRDLKPSNVLVTLEGETAVPKIIDFGVAKAVSQRLTEQTIQTQLGWLVGTPAYMSPEQFHPDGADVDTRTDIYGLSVLLYELLVGTVPFDAQTLRRKGYAEMQRVIQQTEPERPSARLARLDGEEAHGVAAHRGTTPRDLARTLRGDLDWITIQGLAKERSDRYATAGDLAADLRRCLAGQPVLARPPTLAYRTRKFVQRHRVGVAIGASVAALLIGTAVTMTVQSIRLERALGVAEQQRARAEQVSAFLIDLLKEPDPREEKGDKLTVREVLDAGAQKIGTELEDQPAVKAEVLVTMANVYRELGSYDRARALMQSAVDLQEATPASDPVLTARAYVYLGEIDHDEGELDAAAARYAKALALLRARGEPSEPLANALKDSAVLHIDRGEYAAAVAPAQESLALFEKLLGHDNRETAQVYATLGRAYNMLGEHARADESLREGLAINSRVFGAGSYSTAPGLNAYAIFLRTQGRYEEAVAVLQKTLEIYRRTLGEEHSYTAINRINLAQALHASGRYPEAEREAAHAVASLKQEFGEEHALVPTAEVALGSLYLYEGRFREAEKLLREVLALDRKLQSGDANIAATLSWLGILARELGRYEESESVLREALSLRLKALGPEHDGVGASRVELGRTLTARGDYAHAHPLIEEGLELQRKKLGAAHPRVALNLIALAAVEQALGDIADARGLYETALAAQRKSLRTGHPDIAKALLGLAEIEAGEGSVDLAEKRFREALEIRSKALPATHPDLANARSELGELLCRSGRAAEGAPMIDEALRTLETSLPGEHPQLDVVRKRRSACGPPSI